MERGSFYFHCRGSGIQAIRVGLILSIQLAPSPQPGHDHLEGLRHLERLVFKIQ